MKDALIILITILISSHLLFAQDDGDYFFNAATVHEIRLTFNQTSFWDSLIDGKEYADATGNNVYIQADATIDGAPYYSIGVRIKGNSSYNAYPGEKKPFKLKFDEFVYDQEIDGLNKLTLNNGLNDPTMLREKLLLDYSRKQGVIAPRAAFARVYLNEEYWGLYSVVEQIDKTFLGDMYVENNGNLFKGDPMARLQWEGASDTSYYDNVELKTNESINDWSDLVSLINVINNTLPEEFENSLNEVFNTTAFLRNNALNSLFVSLDTYVGMGHNYYIYHNLWTDKFEWITWDANSCFGVFNNGMSISELQELSLFYIKQPSFNLPLIAKIYNNENLSQQYLNHVANFLTDDFTVDYLYGQIDSLADMIRVDLYADTKKMFSNSEFEDNIEFTTVIHEMKQIPALKAFLAERIPSVINQLETHGISVQIDELSSGNTDFKLFPNPTNQDITLTFEDYQDEIQIDILDMSGKVVHSHVFINVLDVTLSILGEKGVYFLHISSSDNQSKMLRVIKI